MSGEFPKLLPCSSAQSMSSALEQWYFDEKRRDGRRKETLGGRFVAKCQRLEFETEPSEEFWGLIFSTSPLQNQVFEANQSD
ncbi:hypothetical protein Trydic_g9096 [Trypoxylus dichotomus]